MKRLHVQGRKGNELEADGTSAALDFDSLVHRPAAWSCLATTQPNHVWTRTLTRLAVTHQLRMKSATDLLPNVSMMDAGGGGRKSPKTSLALAAAVMGGGGEPDCTGSVSTLACATTARSTGPTATLWPRAPYDRSFSGMASLQGCAVVIRMHRTAVGCV